MEYIVGDNQKWQRQVNRFHTMPYSHGSPGNPFHTQKLTAQSPAAETNHFHLLEMHGSILQEVCGRKITD